jgi:alkylhydroperoxidase family enzyme
MTRIRSLPVNEWDSELRDLANADKLPPIQQKMLGIYANSPELAKLFFTFVGGVSKKSVLRSRLLELVRLRIAFHNQCRSCMAVRYESALEDGVTEGLVCSLDKPMDAPDLTGAEKAAIEYADLAASNHFAITDATFENLRKYFTEKEIVELCIFSAYCIGFGRMAAAYRIEEELPKSFQQTGQLTPWGDEHRDRMVIVA